MQYPNEAVALPRTSLAGRGYRCVVRAGFAGAVSVLIFCCGKYAVAENQSPSVIPSGMTECENGVCGTWIINGRSGAAQWSNGAAATLTVERSDADAVVIYRKDIPGSQAAGLSVRYQGVRQGNQIVGTAAFTWPGGSSQGRWFAIIEDVTADEALKRGKEAYANRNYFEASRWFLDAARKGNTEAQSALNSLRSQPPQPTIRVSPGDVALALFLGALFNSQAASPSAGQDPWAISNDQQRQWEEDNQRQREQNREREQGQEHEQE
jgi:hypothetical protein